jgi:parallel beta-helix repeat protein
VFVTNNYEWGIHLYSSTNVGLFDSVIKSNLGDGGVYLEESDNNYIQNNEILDNEAMGIALLDSNSNMIIDNTISSYYGCVYFYLSNNNCIDGNIIKQYSEDVDYGYGIILDYSSNNNTLIYNEISSKNNAFVIYDSNDNIIFLNSLISDNSNVYSESSTNIWQSPTMYNYEYNGGSHISCLGNYWSDYVFNDNNNDGIGDLPHDITITDKDHFPLISSDLEDYSIGSEVDSLILTGYCPIDLELIDPDGLKINKIVNEILDAVYLEADFNGDGELDDKIIIPNPKDGNYQIIVIPEPGATPTDTYSLEIVLGDTTITLADDQPIGDTPSQSYIINSDEGDIEPVVTSDINIHPGTLNSKSKGKWITCYIELDGT